MKVPEDFVFTCWIGGSQMSIGEVSEVMIWEDGAFSLSPFDDNRTAIIGCCAPVKSDLVEIVGSDNEKFQEMLLKAYMMDVMR